MVPEMRAGVRTVTKPATGARAILTADEQREHIVGMILRREWHPGASHEALAREWGIGVRTVSQRALEASHAVRVGSDKDNKDFIAESLAELDSLIAEARQLGKPRDAAYCIELKAKMRGALAPTRTQAVEPDHVARMSPKEKREAHLAAIAEIDAAEDKEARH